MYVVKLSSNGVKRWVRVASAASLPRRQRPTRTHIAKRVYIIDNGGTPFLVELSSLSGPGTAHVLRSRGVDEDGADLRNVDLQDRFFEPWRSLAYNKAWVGLDPEETKTSSTKISSLLQRVWRTGPTWWHGGNSVLLKVAGTKYVSIGRDIFAFTAKDEISIYVSYMGNSAVPYPYAVGRTNTYLTSEKAFIPNDWVPEGSDPYDVYYDLDNKKTARLKLSGVSILHKRLW
jgi:hypothetical protein